MLHHWSRADSLWDMMVRQLAVQPNGICYTALAKAHLLSGRPSEAIDKMDAMVEAGLDIFDAGVGQVSILRLQALLLLCHSEPSERHLSNLAGFMKDTASLNCTGWGSFMQNDWKLVRRMGRRLGSKPLSLSFRQILCHDNCRRCSVMTSWPDYPAGSGYLQKHDVEGSKSFA